ncbi:MAG: DUF4255 domain-containing protein [Saprospiraceae bacterium]|nr:DUF4255 domain-containing protein [Candidatus Brachybacter algidus]MBK8747746.1 DUF4255 domain-containing protein [Candidatus Brachybacter algidus]
MIHEVIPIIAGELKDYLESKFGSYEDVVIISNLINQDGSIAIREDNKIVVTLLNIERDGSNMNFGGGMIRTDMPLHINLYMLFSSYFTDYAESLKFLSGVIGFFQGNPQFMIDDNTIKAELFHIDFRELSNLWTCLGAKIVPHVLFKFRTLNMDEGRIREEIPPITGITI